MTIWLIHGVNVSDGGEQSIGRLAPHLSGDVHLVDYGWTGVITLRCTNRAVVADLMRKVKPGDVLIGHSNGALICWELAQRLGNRLGAVVVINPAMRRDTRWPDGLPVLCLANSTDWVVQLGRVWSRAVDVSYTGIVPLMLESVAKGSGALFRTAFQFKPHGWGAAGRYGFTGNQKNVTNFDTAESWWLEPVRGHSGVFKPGAAWYWGGIIDRWLIATMEKSG